MSMHVEWDTATSAGIELVHRGEALGDAQVDSEAALVLGGSGGGALCVEGTLAELRAWARTLVDSIPIDPTEPEPDPYS
jgi:hypothetical protein